MSLNVCLGSLLVVVACCALLLRTLSLLCRLCSPSSPSSSSSSSSSSLPRWALLATRESLVAAQWAACALEVRALAGPAEGSGARGVRAALEIAAGAAGALAVAHGGSHPLTQGHPVVALVSTLDASLPCLHLAVLLVAQAVGALAGRLCVERLWATQFSFHHVIRHMLARAGECVVSPPPAVVVVVPTTTTTATTAADGGHQALIEAMLTEAALSMVLALVVLRLGVPSSTSSAKAGGASDTTTTTTSSGDVGTTTSTTSSSRRSGGSGRVDVGPVSRTRALFIAACVATLSCIVESTSLGVLNPAVALALMWGCSTPSPSRLGLVYLLAPVLGALLAVFLYRGRVPLLFSRQLLYRTKPRPGPPPRPAQPAAPAAPQLRARAQGAGKKAAAAAATAAAASPLVTPTGKATSLNAGKRGKAQ